MFYSVPNNSTQAALLLRDAARVLLGPNQAPSTSTQNQSERVQSTLSSLFRPYGSRPSERVRARPFTSPWSHDFFCVSEPNTSSVPRPEETVALHSAGLGKRNVKFRDSKCSFKEFCSSLYEYFPALKESGGFKIMRASRNKDLIDIPVPSGGYTIDYFRHESGLNRAMAYIVPLQHRLTPCDLQVNNEILAMETCHRCSLKVPLCELQKHLRTCQQNADHADDSFGASTSSGPSTSTQVDRFQVDRQVSLRVGLMLDPNMSVFNSRMALPLRKLRTSLNLPAKQFEDLLRETFPLLKNKEFQFCKVDCHRKVHVLPSILKTPQDFKVYSDMGRSGVYIRPKEDLKDSESDVVMSQVDPEDIVEPESVVIQVDPEDIVEPESVVIQVDPEDIVEPESVVIQVDPEDIVEPESVVIQVDLENIAEPESVVIQVDLENIAEPESVVIQVDLENIAEPESVVIQDNSESQLDSEGSVIQQVF
nr:uncharacterized protein LOC129445441 [Misgurnus anguillicaudatus]